MNPKNNPTPTVKIIRTMGWLALADPSGLSIWLVLGLSTIVVLHREFS
ncbi:hypothetical protein [Larsenimonas salina]|nr:hypothetical protein [Larsenimonas salina]MCM5705845.1 hypothetical protein [Larsenimonas salina]